MKKRIVAMALVGCLIISGIGIISAGTDISNSMDFQGKAISLSLDEAINKALNDSFSGKQIEWNKENAEASYWDFDDDASDADMFSKRLSDLHEHNAEFYKDQRERNYVAEQNALKAEVNNTYFTIKSLEDLVTINEENMNTRQRLYDNCKTKFELGMVARQDLLQAEYEMINAETEYKEAAANLKKTKMGFNILLGLDTMQEVILTDEINESTALTDVSLSDAISKALIERNEIHGAEFKIELQKLTIEVNQSKGTSAGVAKKARIALDEATDQYDVALKDVERDVRSKYLDVKQKEEAIIASKKSVEAVEEALRLTQLSYEAGLAILTDVQEIQTKVFQAKVGLSNAMLDYNLAVDAYNESMGVGRSLVPLS